MIIGLFALALLGSGCCNPEKDRRGDVDPEKRLTDTYYTDVAVIRYFNTFLIADELILAGPEGTCGEQHWHTKTEVIALSGTPYSDPAPYGCGFCPLSECPVVVEFFEQDCLRNRNCIF